MKIRNRRAEELFHSHYRISLIILLMDSERIGKEESCLGMKVLGYEIETFMNDSISFSISLS